MPVRRKETGSPAWKRLAAGCCATQGSFPKLREGTRRLYRARVEGFNQVRAFLEEFRDGRLQVLKVEAARAEEARWRPNALTRRPEIDIDASPETVFEPPPVDVKTPTRRGREGPESRRNTYRCGWYG